MCEEKNNGDQWQPAVTRLSDALEWKWCNVWLFIHLFIGFAHSSPGVCLYANKLALLDTYTFDFFLSDPILIYDICTVQIKKSEQTRNEISGGIFFSTFNEELRLFGRLLALTAGFINYEHRKSSYLVFLSLSLYLCISFLQRWSFLFSFPYILFIVGTSWNLLLHFFFWIGRL